MFRWDIIFVFTEMLYKSDIKLQLCIPQYPKDTRFCVQYELKCPWPPLPFPNLRLILGLHEL